MTSNVSRSEENILFLWYSVVISYTYTVVQIKQREKELMCAFLETNQFYKYRFD